MRSAPGNGSPRAAGEPLHDPVLDEAVREAARLLWEAAREGGARAVVAFTGSGISAESGIPVFRGNEGLWEGFRAEDLATPAAFRNNPERVWNWYHWRRDLVLRAAPNPAHRTLADMEDGGMLGCVITQNVDGLHQRAGSRRVIELHGNIHRCRCTRCSDRRPLEDEARGVVMCRRCGSPARPDIVWFGEMLPEDAWNEAFAASVACRAMLVIGTSGSVYPAAGLCEVAASPRPGGRARIITVNPEATELDHLADVQLRARAGQVLPLLLEELEALRAAG